MNYLVSVHTPDYSDRDDVLINPDVEGINLKQSVVDKGVVRDMTEEEIKANTPEPIEPTLSLTQDEIEKLKDLVK